MRIVCVDCGDPKVEGRCYSCNGALCLDCQHRFSVNRLQLCFDCLQNVPKSTRTVRQRMKLSEGDREYAEELRNAITTEADS